MGKRKEKRKKEVSERRKERISYSNGKHIQK
jgi:hypothetical protein